MRRLPYLTRLVSVQVSLLAPFLVVSVMLSAGCTACTPPTLPPIEVVPARLEEGKLIPLADGDPVDLVRPIQGGHVLFIGALVHNPSDGDGTVLGELRQTNSDGSVGPVIVYDERTTAHEALPAGTPAPQGQAGWRQVTPDISSVANIPVCPNFLDYDLVDATVFLRIRFKDSKGREGFADRKVKTRCIQTDPMERSGCRCECTAKYTIDRCTVRPDGG